jgi:hypothetical protein
MLMWAAIAAVAILFLIRRVASDRISRLVPAGPLAQWQTALPAYRKATAADADGCVQALRRAEDDGWPAERATV